MRRKKTKAPKIERRGVSSGFTDANHEVSPSSPEKNSRVRSNSIAKKLKLKSKKLVKVRPTDDKVRGEYSCPTLSPCKPPFSDDAEGTSNDGDMSTIPTIVMNRSLSACDGYKENFNEEIGRLLDIYSDDAHKSSSETKSDPKVKASSVMLNLHTAHTSKSSSGEHSLREADLPGSIELRFDGNSRSSESSKKEENIFPVIRFDSNEFEGSLDKCDALWHENLDVVNVKIENSKSPSPVQCDPLSGDDTFHTDDGSHSQFYDEAALAHQNIIKTNSTKEQLVEVQHRLHLDKYRTKIINGETYEQQGHWLFKVDIPPPRPYQDTPKIYSHGVYPAVSGTFIDLEAQYQEDEELFI